MFVAGFGVVEELVEELAGVAEMLAKQLREEQVPY